MAKTNFSIHVLDEYAKKITYALAKRLYEAKTHLKFDKALFEASEYPEYNYYTFYMDNSVFYEYISDPDMEITDILDDIKDVTDISFDYTFNNDGITFITETPEEYERLVIFFEDEYSIPTEIINDNLDEKYLNS